ncbi:hypothetical protein PROSTU_02579 [Providencia stuartii ATCC 25827]|uniref:Uncharacterized protein n=1 Tax=Providencia stuartii ATCC 25827 TaxID=471874 RepID=A0AA86YLU5_PROST|nr:hypothetical protein PROSTU_02579 [Providencia stuartii ATCC 25827]
MCKLKASYLLLCHGIGDNTLISRAILFYQPSQLDSMIKITKQKRY